MIQSLLDTDLYKFTTSYAYKLLYPLAEGTFKFQDRGKRVYTDEEFKGLRSELYKLGSASMSEAQFKYVCENIPYITKDYWEWLKDTFRFDPMKIDCYLDEEKHLHIEVTDLMYKVTLYEVPILSIVSEFVFSKEKYDFSATIEKLNDKIKLANEYHLVFSEFGTRRRCNSNIQRHVISILKDKVPTFAGTSNVHYAAEFGLKAIGTYPHEWPMFHAAITGGYIEANNYAMEDWVKVYDGYLGTALIDAFTTPVFLKNFSKKLAHLFDGVRQDSGDEYKIGNMIIDRYKELGIDPRKKFIIFSNALNFEKYADIARYFEGKIGVSAGIGTNLTNDPAVLKEEGEEPYKPSNIVMKLDKCRLNAKQDWHNCIKISDDAGKEMGNPSDVLMAKYQLGLIDHLNYLPNE